MHFSLSKSFSKKFEKVWRYCLINDWFKLLVAYEIAIFQNGEKFGSHELFFESNRKRIRIYLSTEPKFSRFVIRHSTLEIVESLWRTKLKKLFSSGIKFTEFCIFNDFTSFLSNFILNLQENIIINTYK